MRAGPQRLLFEWPAVRWFLLISSGILLARFASDASVWPFFICGIFGLIVSFFMKKVPFAGIFQLLTSSVVLFSAGFFSAQITAQRAATLLELDVFEGDTVRVSGRMTDFRTNSYGGKSAVLQADSISFSENRWEPLQVGFMARWQSPPAFQADTAGIFSGVFMSLPPRRPDERFDYRQWLLDQGITHRMQVLLMEPGSGRTPGWMFSFRNRLFRQIDSLFPPAVRGLMKALLIGYKYEIDDEMKVYFSDSGLSHLMAVSGLHVLYVMGPVLLIFGWIGSGGSKKHVLMAVTVLLLVWYSWLTGLSASVLRASLMMILFTMARLYQLRTSSANIVAASAVLILLWRPFDLFNAGFQLSYAAVILLILFASPVSELLPERIRETWYGKLALVAPVSFVIQLGLWPVLAAYFEKVSTTGPIANIPALYLSEFAVLAGAASLITDALFPELAFIPAFVAEWSARGVALVAAGLGSVSWATVSSAIAGWTFFLGWIPLIGFVARWSDKWIRNRWVILSLAGFSIHFTVLAINNVDIKYLRVHFFDVGQGDAALLTTPSGKHLLIDTGGLRGFSAAAAGSIVPYLRNCKIDTLHAVLITHDHLDHSAGLQSIGQQAFIKTLYLPPDPRTDAFSKAISALRTNTLKARGTNVQTLAAGDELILDPDVFAGVIAPFPSLLQERDKNMTSLSLILRYGNTRYLFTGDLPEEGEEVVAHAFGDLLDADVIKAAHHGSRYSSTPVWLQAATPKIVVVSSALQNRYGHPHAEAVARFRDTGASIYYTALHGMVTVQDWGEPDRIRVIVSKEGSGSF